MIVAMKQVSLLVLDKYKDESLAELRKMGLLHVKYMNSAKSSHTELLEVKIEDIEKALLIISGYPLENKKQASSDQGRLSSYAAQIVALSRQRQRCVQSQEDIKGKISWYETWGEFSLDKLKELRNQAVYVRLYRCNKRELQGLRKNKAVEVIKRKGNDYYIALISLDEKEKINLAEFIPPETDIRQLRNESRIIENKISSIDNILRQKAGLRNGFNEYLNYLKKSLDFNKVKAGMQQAEELVCLQGFMPTGETGKLVKLSEKKGWAYLIREPGNPREVPTLIKNPRWLRIIDPVFKFMGTLPGYDEPDVSFTFLLFLGLFFALLIGDAGYGLIFLLATYLIRKKASQLPAQPFILMYVLSLATVIWGAASGTWFGFEQIARLPFLRSVVVSDLNSFIASNQYFMMYLCFIIGAVHLTIAHITLALRIINSIKALAEFGWILIIWSLFFVVGKVVLGRALYEYTGIIFSLGAILVLLFSNPGKNILKGIAVTLGNLPLRVISSFSDIVSYLRLFAVGYASVAVAGSFNAMASRIGFHNIAATFISAFILFLGHGLNIILGLMAVIVHGIRLNMLEFSTHLGMQWSGFEYKPFKE
ncbi:MAG: hypothetical protein KJ838_04350 [Candidatus Omnitrophica bacterium]|nr:hypothetical protein [Candidatus Omnitrophota bacterium]